MTEATTPLPPSIESWRGEFMQAAERHAARRRSPLQRLLDLGRLPVLLLAVFAIGSAGAATAAIIKTVDSPEMPPYAGESHGFINLETGLPIRCPDGSLLTYTPPPGPGPAIYGPATCDDGSVPPVYARQREAMLDYLHHGRFGAKFENGPRFEYDLRTGP
jgi:hypothetical protein